MLARHACLAFYSAAMLCAGASQAQPPDVLRSYELIPNRSSFTKAGGFAGFHETWPLFGEFDFVTGYEPNDPRLDRYAAFVNEYIWIAHPLAYPGFALDGAIDLETLEGSPLPTPAAPPSFELFEFTGEDNQGFPAEVLVATLGRWLYMRGGNEPSCCDFFEYDFHALARQTPNPDFDNNGLVDSSDVAYWQTHIGADSRADLNGDNMTDGMDFLLLQRELGSLIPTVGYFESIISTALSSSSLANVPEPSAGLLAASVVLLVGLGRQRCVS